MTILVVSCLAVLFGLIGWGMLQQKRELGARWRAWIAFQADKGLVLDKKTQELVGTLGAARVTLDWWFATKEHQTSYARLKVESAEAIPAGLIVHPTGYTPIDYVAHPEAIVTTGDAELDAAFVVEAIPESTVALLLDEPTRRAILRIKNDPMWLAYADGAARICWRQGANEAERLRLAWALAEAAALWRPPGAPYR